MSRTFPHLSMTDKNVSAGTGHWPVPQVRKSLLQLVFSGAYLLRWNDKLRPRELLEIDKQAHKMIVAFLLLEQSSHGRTASNNYHLAKEIIEGALFDYFFRLVVTDIKPPIFYRIKNNKAQFRQLKEHVTDALRPVLEPLGPFWDRFRAWHSYEYNNSEARRLLQAAHLFASQWEFSLIKPLNEFDAELPSIAESFRSRLDEREADIPGLDSILSTSTPLGRFASFCGQLRFQVRWSQLPRIPQTDVLGHMFIVATYAYFFSLMAGACTARCCNNFFCGLFHDLPELMTRDIISPVKKSSNALASLIRQCEDEEMERRIFAPLRGSGEFGLVGQLRYFLGIDFNSEFQEGIRRNGIAESVQGGFSELQTKYNQDAFDPRDGQLLKACDNLAAFLEADTSIRNGVSSPHLYDARARLKQALCDRQTGPECLHLDSLLADFD